MKQRLAVLTVLICLTGPVEAGVLEDCTQTEDWWKRIEACTDAIDSGDYQGFRASWAYSNRAVAHAALNNYLAAFDDHEKAVRLNPADAQARNNKANSHADFREWDRALKEYSAAIRLRPDYTNAYFNRAGVYMATGRYEDAAEDYSEVLSAAPDFGEAYAGRAEALCQTGAVDASVSDRMQAIALGALSEEATASYLRETGYLRGDAADGDSLRASLTDWTVARCP